jgi:hypothetical protein
MRKATPQGSKVIAGGSAPGRIREFDRDPERAAFVAEVRPFPGRKNLAGRSGGLAPGYYFGRLQRPNPTYISPAKVP